MRVFAGDKFKPAADASYINFDAGIGFNAGYNVRENKQIGTIDSWGPYFRISFDLFIHSYDNNDKHSSVLAFKGNGGISNCCENGDRIPFITVVSSNREILLSFANSLNQNGNYYFFFNINLKTWYNIKIEQEYVDRNVSKTSSFSSNRDKVIDILRITIELKLMEN